MKVFTVLGTEQMFMKCFCFFVLLFPVICVCFHGLSHVWRHGNTWYHMIWIYILTSHVISHGTLFWSRTGQEINLKCTIATLFLEFWFEHIAIMHFSEPLPHATVTHSYLSFEGIVRSEVLFICFMFLPQCWALPWWLRSSFILIF